MKKAKAAKRRAKRYPKLPAEVQGAGGAIAVRLLAKMDGAPDEDVMGQFDPQRRTIDVRADLRGDQQWMVLFHELAHAALWDCGAHNALAGPSEEIVCDAIATARLRERFG